MADVFLAAASADRRWIADLSEVFQRGGLRTATYGAPVATGAVIIVWSHAAERDPGFRKTAAELARDARVCFALVGGGLAPLGVEGFDLNGWSGDPDDPLLDPLFRAVDRIVLHGGAVPPTLATPVAAPERQRQRAVRQAGSSRVWTVAALGLVTAAGLAFWLVPPASEAPPALADAELIRLTPDPIYGPPGVHSPGADVATAALTRPERAPAGGPVSRAREPDDVAPPQRSAPRRVAEPAAQGAAGESKKEGDDRAAYRGEPIWEMRPGDGLLTTLRPERAAPYVEGVVRLSCTVRDSLDAACRVVNERPAGHGFGAAALEAAQVLKAAPTTTIGADAVGARTTVELVFPSTES